MTYKVVGMTCGGCVKALGRALDSSLPGLQYEISLEEERLTVDGDHEPQEVARAVEDAGFEVLGS